METAKALGIYAQEGFGADVLQDGRQSMRNAIIKGLLYYGRQLSQKEWEKHSSISHPFED